MADGLRSFPFRVDAERRLVAEPGDARQLGLEPGSALLLEAGDPLWVARRPVSDLAKVYVEPTNRCNLRCRTCVRNVWDIPSGFMPRAVFEAVVADFPALPRPPSVFFGGLGEPLAHPEILWMIECAQSAGARVELITNGILLGDETRRALASAGLHRLWVSIDGATPEGYEDVRLGDALPEIVENLRAFQRLRAESPLLGPRLGIAFVAMRRNVAQLPAVVRLGREVGMDRLLVTNVIAYTEELREEVLYDEGVSPGECDSTEQPAILLPRLEWSTPVRQALAGVLLDGPVGMRPRVSVSRSRNFCPFVEAGAVSVRWDGAVGPCLPLLHEHDSWLGSRRRHSHELLVGRLPDRGLRDVWLDPSYVDLRRRLQAFAFSPCSSCNTCELADDNGTDCSGSPLPACGGCLWAQGLVQCP